MLIYNHIAIHMLYVMLKALTLHHPEDMFILTPT